jgi:hypothetical protein
MELPRLYERPVHELDDAEILFSTICRVDQDRERKSWGGSYPECFFCGLKYRWSTFGAQCHMDPSINKASCGKERIVAACAMSSRSKVSEYKVRYNELVGEMRKRDKANKMHQGVLSREDKKRKLGEVGGDENHPLVLDGAGGGAGTAGGQQRIGGPRVTREEMNEAWSEAAIKNGLSLKIFSDPLFRLAVCKTAQCGEQAVTQDREGKKGTTLPRRSTFSEKIIPATDARLDAENMRRMKSLIEKQGSTLSSDGWQNTADKPIVNVLLGVDGLLTLRLAVDTSGQDKTMPYIFSIIERVIEEVGPENVFAVVMDGACKGAFPLIREKYSWIQCFVCPSHGIDGFLKNVCSDKEDIRMQANAMGGIGASETEWDEPFFKNAFGDAWSCIKTVTSHQKPLAIFREIAAALPLDQQPKGGTEPKKFGETRYGTRIAMGERMLLTKSIYEKLFVHEKLTSWLDKQKRETKDKVRHNSEHNVFF